MNCRFCKNPLEHIFVDLGKTALANSYLSKESDFEIEKEVPLNALVC
ncbi:SAM-dependent methyltransferase, partial [Nitrosopumilus sp.]|nr:SAM-dependent methyltransferase [Nitrosopumilus sp.]